MGEIVIQTSKDRYDKGNSLIVLKNSSDHFYVKAASCQKWYSVQFYSRMRQFYCSCEDHMRRRKNCKHIMAVIRQHAKNIKVIFTEDQN